MEVISIHALREEGDRFFGRPVDKATNISIHALREEGDLPPNGIAPSESISIHALREEGDLIGRVVNALGQPISIHALREEGDTPQRVLGNQRQNFYPRPPRGGRPYQRA